MLEASFLVLQLISGLCEYMCQIVVKEFHFLNRIESKNHV